MPRRLLLAFLACVASCGHATPDIEWVPSRRDGQGWGTVQVRRGELLDLEIEILRAMKRPPFDHCVLEFSGCNGGPDADQFLVQDGSRTVCARATCGNDVEGLLAYATPKTLPHLEGRGGGDGWTGDDDLLGLAKLVINRDESRELLLTVTCHASAGATLGTIQKLTDARFSVLLMLRRDTGRKCPIPEGCRTCY